MHQEPALTYLVADGARARLMKRHGDGRFSTFANFSSDPLTGTRKDTRGRVFGPTGRVRSAIEEPDADPGRRRFATELAEAVEGFVVSGEVDRLVLVAPPRMLADIRSALSGRAARTVAGQLPKDLTKLPEGLLREALDELVLRTAS
jgi:protein required for attachment to host cells